MFDTVHECARYRVLKESVTDGWEHTYPIGSKGIPFVVFSDVDIEALDEGELIFTRPAFSASEKSIPEFHRFKNKRVTARAKGEGSYYCIAGDQGRYPLHGDFRVMESGQSFYVPIGGGVFVLSGEVEIDGQSYTDEGFYGCSGLSKKAYFPKKTRCCVVWPKSLKEIDKI